jgi:hypothetical protein
MKNKESNCHSNICLTVGRNVTLTSQGSYFLNAGSNSKCTKSRTVVKLICVLSEIGLDALK